MTTKEYEILDRYGRVVRREDNNGILQDGQTLRVRMTMQDAQNQLALRDASAQLENHQLIAFADAVNGGMSLDDAIAKAKSLKRIEQFDARGHRPGFIATADSQTSETARDAYFARTNDAWKNPVPVLDQDIARKHAAPVAAHAPVTELVAARDMQQRLRDERTSQAWRQG